MNKEYEKYLYAGFGFGAAMTIIGFAGLLNFKMSDTFLLATGVVACAMIYRYAIGPEMLRGGVKK